MAREPLLKSTTVGFSVLADRWLRDWSRNRLTSHATDESRLRNHLLPLLGDVPGQCITGRDP